MTTISKRLEQVVRNTIARAPVIPVKIETGILVGDVLIESCGALKNLWRNEQLIYQGLNLNVAAIKIANVLVKQGNLLSNQTLYAADQEYGRLLIDSQIHYKNYQRAKLTQNFDRADNYWARYCESRDRCQLAKQRVERLSVL
jgi:hypothetical protein